MGLAQGNFERAVDSAAGTLSWLETRQDLSSAHSRVLQNVAWDLEAIGAAIRLELMNRETDKPIDFG